MKFEKLDVGKELPNALDTNSPFWYTLGGMRDRMVTLR
jgi:hypothetical protein